MMLRPFREQDYQHLIQWIDSDELNYLWGGPTFSYPLTVEQVAEHYANPELYPYIFVVDDKEVGFVELYHVEGGEYRICRVLIAADFRGQNLSTTMLKQLMVEAQQRFHCTKVSLAVFAHNAPAIACYTSLGFKSVAMEKDFLSFSGESWDLLRMEKSFL